MSIIDADAPTVADDVGVPSGDPVRPPRERWSVFRALVAVAVVIVALLVIYPLATLLVGLFFVDGEFVGLASVVETLEMREFWPAVARTAVLLIVGGALSMAFGAVLAWLNERTTARMGWVSELIQILPLMLPALAVAIGYVILFAPGAGYINVILRTLFGDDSQGFATGPLDIYGMIGLIAVTVVVTTPLAYLPIAAALRGLDPSLEEAARLTGDSPLGTLWRVTLPAVRGALVTALVLVVLTILSLVSVPIIIGSQGGVTVLSTLIYRVLHATTGPRYDQAIVLSFFMLLAVQAAILFEYSVKRSGHHAKISGKGQTRSVYHLGRLTGVARLFMLLYLAVAILLPLGALIFVSMQPFWSPQINWAGLSFDNYATLFRPGNQLGTAFGNSLLLGIGTATVLMIVAALFAYFAATASGRVARLVNGIAGLPASVPHVVIGVGFLVAVASQRFGNFSLGGTLLILFLAYVVISLPQATRTADAALHQVGRELWESSLTSGASQLGTFARILVPLMLPGLMAGWVIVFTHSFGEISASVFLSRPVSNPVAGAAIVDSFLGGGTIPQLAALTVLVTAAQVVVVVGILVAGRRRGVRRP